MDYNYVYSELEKRGVRTSGSYDRMVARLSRFLEIENRTPVSHAVLNDPPSIVRLDLEEDDLNAARILCEMNESRILCECAKLPVHERVDRLEHLTHNSLTRLENSLNEFVGNENIFHRFEELENRIQRIEAIVNTLQRHTQVAEVPTFSNNEPRRQALTADSTHQSYAGSPSTNYTSSISVVGC